MRNLKRVAVTGAAGFIGSHVVEDLLKRDDIEYVLGIDKLTMGSTKNLSTCYLDPRFNCVTLDMRDYNHVMQLFARHRIDGVFHLATTPLVYSLREPRDAASSIIDMQLVLLEAIRAGHFSYLLSFSTSEVYGSSPDMVLNELSRVMPRTTYAAAKASSDLLTLSYCASFNVDCTILRPFNNYGPRKIVMPGAGIIPTCIKNFAMGKPVKIFGDGLAARDFVYVEDTARAVLTAAFNEESKGQIFNIATGVTHTVGSIVEDIAQLMNVEPNIIFEENRNADVSHLCGDATKINSILGFKAETDWKVGLQKCIQYYSQLDTAGTSDVKVLLKDIVANNFIEASDTISAQ